MDFKNPAELEKYAFWWSEARLVIAAFALLLGGIPPIYMLLPGMYALTAPLLKICWVISGVVSAYLGYRWYTGGQKVFGGKEIKDTVAFAILVVTGLNLGVTGIFGVNIGMSLAGGRLIFLLAGLVYLAVAGYFFKRWNESGKKIF